MKKFQDNRYFPLRWLEEALEQQGLLERADCLGLSEESRPIHAYTFGNGPKKVLIWSQMHGNETTTTKALIDFFEEIVAEKHKDLLEALTLRVIPMLNPDGAERYTRLNANQVDLNRDAIAQTQKESRLLIQEFDRFEPDLCLNLHGQRTIFSVGSPDVPASLSFLAPSFNKEREINTIRKTAMQIIAQINASFPAQQEWGIGRYDDSFNINCMGDYFTHSGVPTILFEAGHYPEDYNRNQTRDFVYQALVSTLNSFLSGSYTTFNVEDYFIIPENQQNFRDIELLNVTNVNSQNETHFLQYAEVLDKDRVVFVPEKVLSKEGLKGLAQIDFNDFDENLTNSYHYDDNLIKWRKMFESLKKNH